MKHNKEKKEIPIKDEKVQEEQKPENPVNETDKLKEEVNILKDTLLRKVAEFDNFKKRTENEILNIYKYSSENIIRELLPVLDDMLRSITSIEKGETKDFETLKTGLFSVVEKFKAVLEKEGLKEIECEGKQFDVNTCDALLQVPAENVEPNTVTEVVEKGYYLKDKIIRHAKVIVSA